MKGGGSRAAVGVEREGADERAAAVGQREGGKAREILDSTFFKTKERKSYHHKVSVLLFPSDRKCITFRRVRTFPSYHLIRGFSSLAWF